MEEVSAGERISELADGVQAAGEALAEHTGASALQEDGGSGFAGRIRGLAAAHPLRLGVVTFALGAIVAAIPPSTAFENERLGEGADMAKEHLSARARELWGRARTAVQRGSEAAVAAALEEFRREG